MSQPNYNYQLLEQAHNKGEEYDQVHRPEPDPEIALSLVKNPYKYTLVELNQEANLR